MVEMYYSRVVPGELYPESCILIELCIGRDVNVPLKSLT